MKDKLIFRRLTKEDYETISKWWEWWRWSVVPREMLPDNGTSGFMVEKNNTPIVCGFVYITNSSIVLLEWVVSYPKYKEKDRFDAIELLINEIEKICKDMGYTHILTMGKNESLLEIHEKLGWTIDKKPSYEIIKNL